MLLWVASDGGGWWVVAFGKGDVALVLGALLSIMAVCWLGLWLGVATSSSFLLVLVVSSQLYRWVLVAVGSRW